MKTIDKVMNLLEERIELAKEKNFETIYITLKPDEAKELLKKIKPIEIDDSKLKEELRGVVKNDTTITEILTEFIQQYVNENK